MERKRYAIIMAAGSGSRMGADMPKQFMKLGGKAILQRTMEVFLEAVPGITIVTVLPEQYIDYWKEYCYRNSFTCPQILVKGGMTRFHSVRNALERIPEGALVGIHDGVRPLVTPGFVAELYSRAEAVPSLIPVTPCIETIKVLREKEGVLEAVPGVEADRSVLYGAQTPQMFWSEVLKDAYRQAYDTSFTDDASVVERNGKSLSFMIGERLNIKITTREDLVLARAIDSIRRD